MKNILHMVSVTVRHAGRHRRICKYWKSEENCFRGNSCEYLHLAKDKFQPGELQVDQTFNDENVLNSEITLLRLEIEKLTVQNKDKEYRIRHLEEDYENDYDTINEEGLEQNNEDDVEKSYVSQKNHQDNVESVWDDDDLDDWFQTEMVKHYMFATCVTMDLKILTN